MYYLEAGSGSNGLLWGLSVLTLIAWMLALAFYVSGAIAHALLVTAVVLLVLNFVRVRESRRSRVRDI